uniref:BTB_2 domain-containing protein n=1 Tax=Caenorhabditis tropicalis TaxID=1561998 RepID=A0A1I7UYD8_9PELO
MIYEHLRLYQILFDNQRLLILVLWFQCGYAFFFSRLSDADMRTISDMRRGREGEEKRTHGSKHTIIFEKLNFHGIKGSFYREDKPLGEYLKKKVRKLFVDPDILDVVDGDRYAFDFTTKDCLLALETYYRTNNAPDKGNGDHLSIKIREFVTSCYYVARNQNKDFVINDKLKFAMFG